MKPPETRGSRSSNGKGLHGKGKMWYSGNVAPISDASQIDFRSIPTQANYVSNPSLMGELGELTPGMLLNIGYCPTPWLTCMHSIAFEVTSGQFENYITLHKKVTVPVKIPCRDFAISNITEFCGFEMPCSRQALKFLEKVGGLERHQT